MALTIQSATLGALAALSLGLTTAPLAQDAVLLQLSKRGQEAYGILLGAERFTSEAVGIATTSSAEVLALRQLWREPSGARALRELEEKATTAGQLFALSGLYYADHGAFDERIERHRKSDQSVQFLNGCRALNDYPVAQLVERSEPGAVRLKPNQTVEAWLASRKESSEGHAIDIRGGGWPELFREREPSRELRDLLTKPGVGAFRRLMLAQRFTDAAIYYGGVTPNEVIALRKLLKEPEARAALAELEERATLPGRLFALCGLYYLNPELFQRRLAAYRGSGQTLFFQTGCTGIHDQAVAKLVDRGEDKAVRLAPGQSNREWLQAHEGSYGYDIAGGGWPNLFLDGGGWRAVVNEDYSPDGD